MDTQSGNQSAAMPTLCQAGCGFYGSPATENLCSKCFKDALKRKQDPNRQAGSAGATLFSTASSSITTDNQISAEVNPRDSLNKYNTSNIYAASESNDVAAAVTDIATAIAAGGAVPKVIVSTTAAADSVASSNSPHLHVGSRNNENLTAPCTATTSSQSLAATASSALAAADDDAKLTPSSSAPVFNTEKPRERTRCEKCNKKVGFTGFECRCGGMFCGVHRYSDMHDCTYDYKKSGAEEIKKNNPVIMKEKIQKI